MYVYLTGSYGLHGYTRYIWKLSTSLIDGNTIFQLTYASSRHMYVVIVHGDLEVVSRLWDACPDYGMPVHMYMNLRGTKDNATQLTHSCLFWNINELPQPHVHM